MYKIIYTMPIKIDKIIFFVFGGMTGFLNNVLKISTMFFSNNEIV